MDSYKRYLRGTELAISLETCSSPGYKDISYARLKCVSSSHPILFVGIEITKTIPRANAIIANPLLYSFPIFFSKNNEQTNSQNQNITAENSIFIQLKRIAYFYISDKESAFNI